MEFRFSYDITLAFDQYESALKWGAQAFRPKAEARKPRLALLDEEIRSAASRFTLQRSST